MFLLPTDQIFFSMLAETQLFLSLTWLAALANELTKEARMKKGKIYNNYIKKKSSRES